MTILATGNKLLYRNTNPFLFLKERYSCPDFAIRLIKKPYCRMIQVFSLMALLMLDSSANALPLMKINGLFAAEAVNSEAATYESEVQTRDDDKIDCRLTIAVGITKAKGASADASAESIASALSNEKVKAIPIKEVSSVSEIREIANRREADYLLLAEIQLGGPSYLDQLACQQTRYRCYTEKFNMKYSLEEVKSGRKAWQNREIGKGSRHSGAAVQEVLAEVRKEVLSTVKPWSLTSSQLPSFRQLQVRNACFCGTPPSINSLTLKFDVKTKYQRISYGYDIKGLMWRMDMRSSSEQSDKQTGKKTEPLVLGFNGEKRWKLNSNGEMEVVDYDIQNVLLSALVKFVFNPSGKALEEEEIPSKINVLGMALADGRSSYLVEAGTRAETYLQSYYDIDNGALLKKVLLDGKKNIKLAVTFGDYREIIQGVHFPYLIRLAGADGETTIEFVEVSLNPELPDHLFFKLKSS